MTPQNSDFEEAEIVEETSDNRRKKVVVYGEYDKHFHSPLRKKRIKISLLDIIVWISIFAILSFIGYRSMESYGASSRDDIRIGHLAVIREGLDKLVKEGKDLPEAFTKKEIIANSSVIGIQGYAGEALFSAIGKKVLRDPLDNSYYIYYYSPTTKQYEVMSYLESDAGDIAKSEEKSLLTKLKGWIIHTTDYASRTPYSIGSVGNILLANVGELKNTPLHTLVSTDRIDLSNLAKYEDMLYLGASCRDILTKFPDTAGKDSNQKIIVSGRITPVYCDMTTDGGGWTLIYANNGHSGSKIRESYVQMREKMTRGVYDISAYDDPNLAGLLDTTHFTTNGAKEILATNRVGGGGKWVRFTFDTSASLAWSLGKDVLGSTNSGCYMIPNNGSWSIINNDGNIRYDGLKKIMNAGGNSWGVSHAEYPCNNQEKSLNPHIGFYRANGNMVEHRTRSTEGIGGKSTDNEYRYFIR